MGRKLLDVKNAQSGLFENPAYASKRQVGEMLVINCVELVLLDQILQVREFQIDRAAGLQRDAQAVGEIIDIGNVGIDVIAAYQIGALSVLGQLGGGADPEKFAQHW